MSRLWLAYFRGQEGPMCQCIAGFTHPAEEPFAERGVKLESVAAEVGLSKNDG